MTNESEPINAGFLRRALTLLVVKARRQKFLQVVWKPRGDILTLFNICVKVKAFSNLAEAHAMQLVASQTSIPVPRVYCAFVHKDTTYIVMSKIEGRMARGLWNSRSQESKARIFEQLADMVSQLRSIKPPAGIGVANVNGGPICDCRLPSRMFWGPFATIADFYKALVGVSDFATDNRNLPADLQELFAFYEQERQQDNKPVFTHGDLSSLNILVQGDDVVGLIDWETSGWFPHYWEYTSAWNVNPYNPFWQCEVDNFVAPLPYELRMESIRRKYFGAF